MKFFQNIFLLIIALLAVVTADAVQSTSTKRRKKTTPKVKFEDIRSKKQAEQLGHSYGLQSYPCKTIFPVNTQALPTTWTSHMGNDW